MLGGEPQLFVMMAGTSAVLCLIWSTHHPVSRSHVLLVGLIPVAAVGITLVQLGPMFTDYLHSIRAGGISYGEASKHSLDLSMLKHLWLPLVFPPDFASNPKTSPNFFPVPVESRGF